MHILLIDDDLDLGPALQQALGAEGVSSEWLRTLADGARFAARAHYDCVLLDLALPDGHGLDLLADWRGRGFSLPVIVITASAALGDRLAGLDGGADDYLVKPFAIPELVARLRAVTRRAAGQAASMWRLGSIRIDERRRQVWTLDGDADEEREANLSPREFELLLALARSGGRVVPKHRLARQLSPLGETMDFTTLEVHIHHLRRKLGNDAIRTVRGVGYLLQA
ncbi:MAG: response regulator [Pseudomonadota bacterium]